MTIAYQMLVSGSEVGRTEKQIEDMCYVYGMEEVEVFIITSSIVVSVRYSDGKRYTQTKRIKNYKTDFYKIELYENLISLICKKAVSKEEIKLQMEKIECQISEEHKWKSKITNYMVFCGVSAVFTLFFGGTLKDATASVICGIFIKFAINLFETAGNNRFFINLVSSAAGGLASCILLKVGMADFVDKVIIGNIMLLIPGLATVNAFKDLISGEMISGLLRFSDALVQAAAIALGFTISIIMMG